MLHAISLGMFKGLLTLSTQINPVRLETTPTGVIVRIFPAPAPIVSGFKATGHRS